MKMELRLKVCNIKLKKRQTHLGCASVWQSMVTSVPAGAPTSWFGTQIIGETRERERKRVRGKKKREKCQ